MSAVALASAGRRAASVPVRVPVPDGLARSLVDDAAGRAAGEWLRAHGFPSRHDEAWHYLRPEELVGALDRPPTCGTTVVDDDVRRLLEGLDRRAVLAGGHPLLDLWSVDDLPPDVDVRVVDRAGALGLLDEPADGFDALNRAAAPVVARVDVAAGVDAGVLHLVHLPGAAASSADHVRTAVVAGAGSRVHLVEVFVGRGGGATNATTTVAVGAGAAVTLTRVQLGDDDTVHVGRTDVRVERDGRAELVAVDAGGALARHTLDVDLAGPGASVALHALQAPAAGQHHDLTATVAHRAPHGTSTQQVRGLVADDARASFTGHVVVAPGAAGTDAAQRDDNLLLGRTARADTRPWLEISDDDVRCTHGATVGRLDDDAVFYLRSRGIPLATARGLLVESFAAAVRDRLPDGVRATVADRVTGAREG